MYSVPIRKGAQRLDTRLYPAYESGMEISLREWVTEAGGAKAAAERIGVAEVTVWKWLAGERRPRPELAARIEAVSDGRVRKESLIWPNKAA